ncbi:hypothetical protein BX600DRAFT_516271 [Xylariales sp. PMI_506]|nr:hypothetical protein BX600DRAFT_516271 [Xylariales sp. PMI_506]
MEKYSQYRDRGSGVSPFIPHTTPVSAITVLLHTFIYLFRLPLLLSYAVFYFLVLTHLPLPAVVRKLLLWCMLAIPGVWWVDLQLDGVKRGHLHQQPPERVPHPGSIIAAQFTSPIDALYLAAIFDPIFTVSYPGSQKVQRISLLGAILLALGSVQLTPPASSRANLTTLRRLVEENPHRVFVVFPECGTTNGKGLLPLSPSLLGAAASTKVFPVSLRYTPQDITTPIPGSYLSFLWNLLSRPTHCIRVRIGEATTYNSTANGRNGAAVGSPAVIDDDETDQGSGDEEPLTPEGRRMLDYVADTLARLARNKRVGLTLKDKAAFVEAWNNKKKK